MTSATSSEPGRSPATGLGPLRALRAEQGALHRIYVAPERRVVFVSVNKNACTSLKWMMADLGDEDLDSFTCGLKPFVTDDEAVHDRRLWKPTSRLGQLDRETRAGIRPENGWFIFGVVRDPRLRFFSAWQNKILMENPVTVQWRAEPWFPRHPVTEQTIIEDFARFTEFMEQHPEHKLRARDGHFRQQVDLLAQHLVPYTRIYEIGELGQLRTDLTAHLDAIGKPKELFLPRANHTPLRAHGALFENGVRESIERMYAEDFAEFGHLWDFSKTMAAPGWTEAALGEVDLVAALSHRMGELRHLAIEQHRRADVAVRRAEAAERELRELQAGRGARATLSRMLRRPAGRGGA